MKPERTPTAKILDAVEEHPRYNTLSKKQNPEGYICFSDGFIAGVRWLESQSSPVESKWVSVKERLPEVPKVLVAHDYGVSEAAYFDGEFFDSRFNHPIPGITHWQNLPELPPIEETKEK